MSIELKMGADPELFVKQGGKFISGHGMVPGNKQVPFPVNLGAVQVDGMALEFNIDPASNEDDFVKNLSEVMNTLRSMLPEGCTLEPSPVAEFGKEYMSTQPPEALEMGCEPDYDAYTGRENKKPNGEVDFRTGAGHIHIGWTEDVDPHDPGHFEACCLFAKALDIALVPSSQLWDKDKKRWNLYGSPGAFRPKPYGMEYRVLSNAWVGNEKVTRWIYKRIKIVFHQLLIGEVYTFSSKHSFLEALQVLGSNTTNCYSKNRRIPNELLLR